MTRTSAHGSCRARSDGAEVLVDHGLDADERAVEDGVRAGCRHPRWRSRRSRPRSARGRRGRRGSPAARARRRRGASPSPRGPPRSRRGPSGPWPPPRGGGGRSAWWACVKPSSSASTSVRVTTAALRRSTPTGRRARASSASISTKPSVACVCAPHQSSGTGGTTARGQLVLHEEVADLGTVSVGDHDLVVVLQEAGDRGHRHGGRGDLVLGTCPTVSVRHRVAAECEQDPHAP